MLLAGTWAAGGQAGQAAPSAAQHSLLKKHGIKDRKYKQRLEERLRTQYTLDPPPRSGRRPVYTEEQMAAGVDALSQPAPFHSTAELVQQVAQLEATGEGERGRRREVEASLQVRLAGGPELGS